MAKILIIDGNPDHSRALRGLFDYRTPHVAVMASTCVEGARACLAENPDIILINALLYMGHNFAFSRVLARHGSTRSIPVLVHSTGELEDLTRRRIEVHGAVGFVQLPVSAGEVMQEVQEALGRVARKAAAGEVKPVSWPSATTSGEKDEVRPVDWGAVEKKQAKRKKAPGRPQSRPGNEAPGRAANGAGVAGRAGGEVSGAFRSAAYDSVDPSKVKGGSEQAEDAGFKRMKWPRVDPGDVKNSGRRRSK